MRIFLAILVALVMFVPILKGKSGYFRQDHHFYHHQNDYP